MTESKAPAGGRADPFVCDGCHVGDFHEFDHFCDALDVQDHELPHAFAAWLGATTGWDGRYERVPGSDDSTGGADA